MSLRKARPVSCWSRATPPPVSPRPSRPSTSAFRSGMSRRACAPGICMPPSPRRPIARWSSRLATLHFAPTAGAARQSAARGRGARAVQVTGNTVIDALLCVQALLPGQPPERWRDAAARPPRPARREPEPGDPGHRPSPRELRRRLRRALHGDRRSGARSSRLDVRLPRAPQPERAASRCSTILGGLRQRHAYRSRSTTCPSSR